MDRDRFQISSGSLAVVHPPLSGIYRIERNTSEPFSAVDWQFARTGSFDGRFDDPAPPVDYGSPERFRVIYAASDASGCLAETMTEFRPAPGLRTRVPNAVEGAAGRAEPFANMGVIQTRWRTTRRLSHTILWGGLRFVDFWDAASLVYFRETLAPVLAESGFDDLDLSAISGATQNSRRLTRACARHVYELTDSDGQPVFAGIRYRSRWGDQWECWAIFSDRLVHAPGTTPTSRPIPANDPDLVACADVLGLRIAPDDR